MKKKSTASKELGRGKMGSLDARQQGWKTQKQKKKRGISREIREHKIMPGDLPPSINEV